MRTNFDFTPFRRATVGFDRLFDMIENGLGVHTAENYPPFDLERHGDDRYRITFAVAGFRPEEIDITAQQNLLIVSGKKNEQNEQNYVHRGIPARSFEQRFVLGDYVQVRSADLRDGLLSIELVREIPEEMRPHKIEIGGGQDRSQIADQRDPAAKESSQQRAAA